MVANLCLFSGVEGFEDLEKIVKDRDARKRGKYNKKIKTDNQYQFLLILSTLINPFTYLSEIYTFIAHQFLTMPLLSKEDAAYSFNGLKVYYSVYTPETYTYYDYIDNVDCICTGEDFQIFQAELAGTENFDVNDRINLHLQLLELLEHGVQLEQATSQLQPEIERIKQIYDKEKADTLARDKSGIFKRV